MKFRLLRSSLSVHPSSANEIVPRLSLSVTASGFPLLRGIQWLMFVVSLLSLTAAGWLGWSAREMDDQAGSYEQAARRVQESNRVFTKQATEEGYQLTEPRISGLAREVSFANHLLEKGAFSWTRFLGALEEAIAPHVSLTSVRINFKDSVITLTGSTLTLKDLTSQIDRLEEHPAFSNVVLAQHQLQEDRGPDKAVDTRKPQETVAFTMTVVYRPPQ